AASTSGGERLRSASRSSLSSASGAWSPQFDAGRSTEERGGGGGSGPLPVTFWGGAGFVGGTLGWGVWPGGGPGVGRGGRRRGGGCAAGREESAFGGRGEDEHR